MKRIETKEDMLQWAREANSGVTIQRKCDLQDVYAHSAVADLDAAFIAAEGERKLIICAVNNTMAFEEVERLLVVLAKHKAAAEREALYAEVDAYTAEVTKREVHLANLENTIAAQREDMQRMSEELQAARTYRIDAERFRQLKQLLAS